MHFGILDPYSLIFSLIIAIPSIILGIYSYYRIWISPEFGKSQYLRLYTFKSVNELILYLLNLFLVRLPVQTFTFSFFRNIANSTLIWIGGALFSIVILAPFPFGVLLSLNRFCVISRKEIINEKNQRSIIYSLLLIYALPLLLTIRHFIWIPCLSVNHQSNGSVFFFLTPPAPKIFDYLVFAFYGLATIVELILNITTLYYLIRQDNSKSPMRRHAETSLYVTTVCNFLVTSTYETFQFFVQFFPFSHMAEIALGVCAYSLLFLNHYTGSLHHHRRHLHRAYLPSNRVLTHTKVSNISYF